ncbi:MAG: ABC transporter ATP-binding protein [Candidatus Parvarchaeota archaeon]|nr:ABC transporter ATP-binding protein [Candidatus Parvarchaeota archaeon]
MAKIEVINLVKKYKETIALDGISFTFEKDGAIGYLGPNGAGKTTTFKIMTGLIRPTSGSVKINGIDATKNKKEALLDIGAVIESPEPDKSQTVREALHMAGEFRGMSNESIDSQISKYNKLLELPPLDFRNGRLSKGQRQRVSLVSALLSEPEILILDEPTSGLDPIERVKLKNMLKLLKKDRLILISSHVTQEIQEVCDSILFINKGKLVGSGSVAALKKKYKTLEKAYEKIVD